MRGRLIGCAGVLLVVIACGGVAQQSASRPAASAGGSGTDSGGSGGANGDPGRSGAGALAAGSSGNIEIPREGSGGMPPGIPDGSACRAPPTACNVYGQYIELEDGTRLTYPLDTSCGQCTYKCELCEDLKCSLYAEAKTGCGRFDVDVGACAALDGNGPCLDTASATPHYVDASGKRWDRVSLSGSASDLPQPTVDGAVDLDLYLTIGDGVTQQTQVIHAHVCTTFYSSLVPC